MLIFTSMSELSKLDTKDAAYPLVKEMVERFAVFGDDYRWQEHGFVCYIEQYDITRVLTELPNPLRLIDIPLFEYVEYRDAHYIAVYLQGDNTSYGFVIPEAQWLTPKLRNNLNSYLDT